MTRHLRRFERSGSSKLLAGLAVTALLLFGPAGTTAQRKGFVLNLGLGPAVTSMQSSGSGFDGPRQNKLAVGTDFKIGYAPSDRLLIYYSNDAAFFGSEGTDAVLSASGLSGLGATYFFKTAAPSFYVQGALGFAALNVLYDDGTTESSTGSGLNLGGGFEFARHWNFDVDLILGSVDNEFGGTLSMRTMRFAISWLLY